MSFYQLAFRYLKRKKAKTILLALVLVFINSMILSTSMLLSASQDSKDSIQEKTGSKVVAEITKENHKIDDMDIGQIKEIENISSINRVSKNTAYPMNFALITDTDSLEEDNAQVTLMAYDDLEKDSPFFEGTYRLTAGSYLKEGKGIVINENLAQINGLELNDELEFQSKDGNIIKANIVGLYFSGNEKEQPTMLNAMNRIENQIFMDHETYSKLFDNDGYYSISIYTKVPEQLHDLQTKVENILKDKAELTTSDALYQQMEAPLNQIIRITSLIQIFTLVTGFVIISLLLCMWMRSRQKEMAIFISLGKTKTNIVMQVLLETIVVFMISIVVACGTGTMMANLLQMLMMNSESTGLSIDVMLNSNDIIFLFCMGGSVVIIAVICSLLPILKAKPKDTLSRMEG